MNLTTADRNIIMSGLSLLLREAEQAPEFVCDPADVRELYERVRTDMRGGHQ